MTSSLGKMHFGLKSAVHLATSACRFPQHSVAPMGDRAWGAAEGVYACCQSSQTMQTKEVCQTGRHLLHTEAAGRRRRREKPERCMGH